MDSKHPTASLGLVLAAGLVLGVGLMFGVTGCPSTGGGGGGEPTPECTTDDDCPEGPSYCGADSDRDMHVTITELLSFITRWKSSDATIADLMESIRVWKNG